MKKKSYNRRRTKIVSINKKNVRHTIKRKNIRKSGKRSLRYNYRIQRGGLSEEQINQMCLPDNNENWKANLSNYISIHIGRVNDSCKYDKNTAGMYFNVMYNLWSKLTDEQKSDLREFIADFVPVDSMYIGKKYEDILNIHKSKVKCKDLYDAILNLFEKRKQSDAAAAAAAADTESKSAELKYFKENLEKYTINGSNITKEEAEYISNLLANDVDENISIEEITRMIIEYRKDKKKEKDRLLILNFMKPVKPVNPVNP
jgi:hypothetical protein